MKPEVLLKAFVHHQSEDAFVELVAGTVDEVYSRALGIVEGPPHLVEEVVLRVYWELARKAPRLRRDVVLTTWLSEHTCKAAVRVLREQNRPIDRAALKREDQGLSISHSLEAAPAGLASRVSHSVLLNTARNKSFWPLVCGALWPAWIRPMHMGAAAVCALAIILLWNIPFHHRNRIILSPDLQMTPASFGQLANPEGSVPPPPIPAASVESNQSQP